MLKFLVGLLLLLRKLDFFNIIGTPDCKYTPYRSIDCIGCEFLSLFYNHLLTSQWGNSPMFYILTSKIYSYPFT